ncbi:MAG: sulfite exporter TauE/SafE family protein [Gammaproteobacteria bacterium]|nr:sulfite exporter TauE/SafE family protein [Gammaproteobacteria bacterium]
MQSIEPFAFILISVAIMVGGVVKGVTGIGLPVVTTAIASSFLPAQLVLGFISIPLVLTNLWQAISAGDPLKPLRRFWLLALGLCFGVWITSSYAAVVDPRVIYGVIGIAVFMHAASSFYAGGFTVPQHMEKWISPVVGFAGGLMGGLSTIWGPLIVIYFLMLRLGKEEFVQVVGWVWLLGSIPLTLGYISNGILNRDIALASAAACTPALAGLIVGQTIRKRIDEQRFQRIVMICLLLIAFNLLRRAFFT